MIGLAKLMRPKDIIRVIKTTLDLQSDDAKKVSDGLLKHNHDLQMKQEGLPLGAYEKNGNFPVPNQLKKRKTDIEDLGEDELSEAPGPMNKTSGFNRPDINKNHFPPQKHRSLPGEWPYTDQNTRFMNNRSGVRRGFTK